MGGMTWNVYMDEIAKEAKTMSVVASAIGAKRPDVELLTHELVRAWVGAIPQFFDPENDGTAAQQLDQNYKHGGGWRPMDGWSIDLEPGIVTHSSGLRMAPIAAAFIRDELILIYPRGFVAIVQPDGAFELGLVD